MWRFKFRPKNDGVSIAFEVLGDQYLTDAKRYTIIQ
jgi:hypothetical protein